MARAVLATSDRLENSSAQATTSVGTIAMWFKPAWNSGDGVHHFLFTCGADNSARKPGVEKYTDNNLQAGFFGFGQGDQRAIVIDTGLFVSGVWALHLLTWDDVANETRYYVDNVQVATALSSLVTAQQVGLSIGNLFGNNLSAAGDVAEFARWTRVLTSGERADLAAKKSPTFIPSGLARYYRLLGNASPEPEFYGVAESLTVTGAAQSTHPPIDMAVNLEETQSLTESLVRQVQRALADTTTFSEMLNAVGPLDLQGVSDTALLTESLNVTRSKLLTDSLALTEALSKGVFVNPYDTLTLTEVLRRLIVHLIGESLGVAETFTPARGMEFPVTLVVGAQDSPTPSELLVLLDVLGTAIASLLISLDIQGPGLDFTGFPVTLEIVTPELEALLTSRDQRPSAILEQT